MTTIAVTLTEIAADSRATRNHEIASWQSQKIIVDNGVIYAVSGAEDMSEPARKWHAAGADPDKAPKCNAELGWLLLVIDRNGMWVYDDKSPHPLKVIAPWTMGSGRDWAMGAMLAGASAKEAVEIACSRDVWSGPPVKVVNIAEALGLSQVREAAE